MSPGLEHLLSTYGYWLMAFGALIEGETFLVAGGIAAHNGIFRLDGLILLAVVGSTVHDVFFFLMGRFFGHEFIKRKPQLFARVEGMLGTFEKYGLWLVIGLRFAYGLRTLIPMVMGMSHLRFRTFLFFDVIGGILWSCTFILGGYFFGAVIDRVLGALDIYSIDLFYILLGAAVIVIGVAYAVWKRQRRKRLLKK